MLGAAALAVEPEHEAARRPSQVLGRCPQPQFGLAVASEIDPGRLERTVALGDQRHPRSLDALQVTLPGDRLVLELCVVGIVVAHLADEQRRGIDDGDPQRRGPRVAGDDDELDGAVEAAGRVEQGRHVTAIGADRCQRGTPWRDRVVHLAGIGEGRDDDRRLVVSRQSANRGRDQELSATDERRRAVDHRERAGGIVRPFPGRLAAVSLLFPRGPPAEPRRLHPDPRRCRDAGPRGDEACRRREQALRSRDLVQTGERDEDGKPDGQAQGGGAVDHALGGHARQSGRGATLERPHHAAVDAIGPRLDEHGIDDVIVELGMILLDRAGRVDEVHPVERQRQEPADGGRQSGDQGRAQPRPAGPGRQAARNQPVLERHAERQPEQCRHRCAEEERRDRHALEVGARCREAVGEVPVGLALAVAGIGPRGDRQGVFADRRGFECRCHRSAPCHGRTGGQPESDGRTPLVLDRTPTFSKVYRQNAPAAPSRAAPGVRNDAARKPTWKTGAFPPCCAEQSARPAGPARLVSGPVWHGDSSRRRDLSPSRRRFVQRPLSRRGPAAARRPGRAVRPRRAGPQCRL